MPIDEPAKAARVINGGQPQLGAAAKRRHPGRPSLSFVVHAWRKLVLEEEPNHFAGGIGTPRKGVGTGRAATRPSVTGPMNDPLFYLLRGDQDLGTENCNKRTDRNLFSTDPGCVSTHPDGLGGQYRHFAKRYGRSPQRGAGERSNLSSGAANCALLKPIAAERPRARPAAGPS